MEKYLPIISLIASTFLQGSVAIAVWLHARMLKGQQTEQQTLGAPSLRTRIESIDQWHVETDHVVKELRKRTHDLAQIDTKLLGDISRLEQLIKVRAEQQSLITQRLEELSRRVDELFGRS